MYRTDDTQPILIDQDDTMVFAHPGAAAAPIAPSPAEPRASAASRVLFALLAVLLFVGGGVAGGFYVAGSTFTQAEVEAERAAAEQAGYDDGYDAAKADADAGAKDQANRAYNDGYREGFEAGLRQGATQAPQAPEDAEGATDRPANDTGKPAQQG